MNMCTVGIRERGKCMQLEGSLIMPERFLGPTFSWLMKAIVHGRAILSAIILRKDHTWKKKQFC